MGAPLPAGQRTFGGLIDDGVKSGARYVLNNFFDGAKQDALDLLTGTYAVSKGAAGNPAVTNKSGDNMPPPSLTACSSERHEGDCSACSGAVVGRPIPCRRKGAPAALPGSSHTASLGVHCAADKPSPFAPQFTALPLITAALLLMLLASVNLFRTALVRPLP